MGIADNAPKYLLFGGEETSCFIHLIYVHVTETKKDKTKVVKMDSPLHPFTPADPAAFPIC